MCYHLSGCKIFIFINIKNLLYLAFFLIILVSYYFVYMIKNKKNVLPVTHQIKSLTKVHPRYKVISVYFVSGKSFKTRSTYIDAVLKLEIDPTTHPAWTKKRLLANQTDNKVKSFNNKYSKFGSFL